METPGDVPGWLQVSGFVVAAYGAVLSTTALVLRRRDTAPRLKVTVQAIHAVDRFRGASPLMLEVRANNIGRMPVHLNTCGYSTSRNTNLLLAASDMPLGERLPATLEPGRSFMYAVQVAKLTGVKIGSKVRLRGWYTDDVGTAYFGRFVRVNLTESSPAAESDTE